MPITLSEAKLASKQFKNSILSINCRSFNKNKSDIIDLAYELSPCILNLSEIFRKCFRGFAKFSREIFASNQNLGWGGGLCYFLLGEY